MEPRPTDPGCTDDRGARCARSQPGRRLRRPSGRRPTSCRPAKSPNRPRPQSGALVSASGMRRRRGRRARTRYASSSASASATAPVIASASVSDRSPRATSGWLVTAIRTKPAPRRRSTARAAPSAIRTSATERGERAVRPSPATSFSTPSRSRNTAARPRCGARASGCKRRGAQALTWSGRRRQSGQPRRPAPPGAPAAKGGSSGASALSIAPLASVVVFRTAISFARRRSNTRVGDLRMVLSAPSAPPSAPHAAPGGIDRGRPWFSFCCTTCASVDAQRRHGHLQRGCHRRRDHRPGTGRRPS